MMVLAQEKIRRKYRQSSNRWGLIGALFLLGFSFLFLGTPLPRAEGDVGGNKKAVASEVEARDEVWQELSVMQIELADTRLQLDELGRIMEQAQQDLKAIAWQMEETQASKEEQYPLMAQRIRAYYESGLDSLVVALFSAPSLSRFWEQMELLSYLVEKDLAILRQYVHLLDTLEEQEARLVAKEREIRELRDTVAVKEAKLTALVQERERYLANLDNRQAYESQLARLEHQWKEEGRPAFSHLVARLINVSKRFNELTVNKEVDMTTLSASLQIQESQLNEFIHGKDPELKGVTFSFHEEGLVAQGEVADLPLRLHGKLVRTSPYRLDFTVENLYFLDLLLPEAVRDEILGQYSFYLDLKESGFPGKFKEIEMGEGAMVIRLGLI